VVQGESRRVEDNAVLGDLVLENLPPRPRGATAIEVVFAVDASGILRVRARDAQTGQEQQASLDLIGTQSPAEVEAARERFAGMRR
jgi:molecular chaperone DnaK